MAGEADIVTVGPSGLKALGRPNFIIEGADRKLYLAVAVLEYDEAAAAGDAAKEEGVATVRRMFEEGVARQPLRACEVSGQADALAGPTLMDDGDGPPGMQTDPLGIQTSP